VSDPDPSGQHHVERAARGFSTRAIGAASRAPRLAQTPTSVPIYQTATFASGDADELGQVLADPRSGYAYSRISNPTTAALGDAYAELAGGEAGLALASGMGAIHAALAALLREGVRIVAPTTVYGSTWGLLTHTFGCFGVRVDVVDVSDLEAVAATLAVAPTGVLYAETIANPTTFVADHAALADLEAGITPGLLRVSVGLEDLEDLRADFGAALAAIPTAALAAARASVPTVGAI
jgi:methionine-gamma-lyase